MKLKRRDKLPKPYYETKLGKLYHGDCLDIIPLIKTNSIHLTITSPPYNMRTRINNNKYSEREQKPHLSKKYEHFHDAHSIEKYYDFHKQAIQQMLRISKTVFWNISIVTGSKEAVFKLIGNFSQNIKDIFIWDKGFGEPAIHEAVANRSYEFIIIFENNGIGRQFSNSNFKRGKMQDIWRLKKTKRFNKKNRAGFPELLPKIIIENWESNVVMDPFLGLGTTAVVCEYLNRRWIGIEIAKEYCDIAVKRIEQAVGRKKQKGMLFK